MTQGAVVRDGLSSQDSLDFLKAGLDPYVWRTGAHLFVCACFVLAFGTFRVEPFFLSFTEADDEADA
jgi:hypothetical protein